MLSRQVLSALLVASVAAQSQTTPAQNDLVIWRDARSGVVRDSLFIEGGIYGQLLDPTIGAVTSTPGGLFRYNFSKKFDQTTDFYQLLQAINVTYDPKVRAHENGFMVADNDEWYTFGGRSVVVTSNTSADSAIVHDQVFIPNAQATLATLGVSPDYLIPKGNISNKYTTNGAGVSVPSEQLGFYFGGLRDVNDTDMSSDAYASKNATTAATQPVNSMLRVDTSSVVSDWSEIPLPDSVPSRADAVLAWLPIGTRGSVIVIGGVTFPTTLYNTACLITNKTLVQSINATAPGFMQTLPIYDIASGTWYSQEIIGPTPPQLAQACAVVASSSDGSVHNIYVYGGYNGVDKTPPSDDVWILSVPSFTWVQVPGQQVHGRYAHVCAKPYPDQMMVVGGSNACGGPLKTTTLFDVFNLNTLEWTGSYDPSVWSNYTVPTNVSNAIQATPTASMAPGLLALFREAYAGTIPAPTTYPSEPTPTSSPSPSSTPVPTPSRKWVVPVAVVVPVVCVIALAAGIWFCCRRRRSSRSEGARSRRSISQWVRGQPPHDKSVISDGETTQVNTGSPGLHEAFGDTYFKSTHHAGVAELNDSHIGTPTVGSPLGSPRGPTSPYSVGSAELPSQSAARYELPAEVGATTKSPAYKNHPMYPPSLGGHGSSVQGQSVSSPSAGPITPYEMPQNRSNEKILPQPPNDMVLGQVGAHSPKVVAARPQSPRINAAAVAGDVSPELTPADVSPSQTATTMPVTPPSQPINTSSNSKSSHTRNTSSLSSGLPDLSSPSPREDYRRSQAISALPDSPNPAGHGGLSSVVSPEVSPASPNQPGHGIASQMGIERQAQAPIRRKEVRNWPRSDATRSAFTEHDEVDEPGRGTV